MSNPQKGEVTLTVNGTDYNLCLTLGAIAKIERDLEVKSLADLDDLGAKGMTGMLQILIALLHGGGHKEVTMDDMMDWDVKLPETMEAIRDAFKAGGFNDAPDDEDEKKETDEGN